MCSLGVDLKRVVVIKLFWIQEWITHIMIVVASTTSGYPPALFEDPPQHDLHWRLLSKVFTPRWMAAIEPLTRQFCVRALDSLLGRTNSTSSPTSVP